MTKESFLLFSPPILCVPVVVVRVLLFIHGTLRRRHPAFCLPFLYVGVASIHLVPNSTPLCSLSFFFPLLLLLFSSTEWLKRCIESNANRPRKKRRERDREDNIRSHKLNPYYREASYVTFPATLSNHQVCSQSKGEKKRTVKPFSRHYTEQNSTHSSKDS